MSNGKLVRDRIPEIIRESGGDPRMRRLDGDAFREALCAKLTEETGEFLDTRAPEELADILEVVYALVDQAGLTPDVLEAIRLEKRAARGGFDRRLFLED
jgi:predicted house-cleaning noncanonical NTP pyrophosphatase (MazG superfamily)